MEAAGLCPGSWMRNRQMGFSKALLLLVNEHNELCRQCQDSYLGTRVSDRTFNSWVTLKGRRQGELAGVWQRSRSSSCRGSTTGCSGDDFPKTHLPSLQPRGAWLTHVSLCTLGKGKKHNTVRKDLGLTTHKQQFLGASGSLQLLLQSLGQHAG